MTDAPEPVTASPSNETPSRLINRFRRDQDFYVSQRRRWMKYVSPDVPEPAREALDELLESSIIRVARAAVWRGWLTLAITVLALVFAIIGLVTLTLGVGLAAGEWSWTDWVGYLLFGVPAALVAMSGIGALATFSRGPASIAITIVVTIASAAVAVQVIGDDASVQEAVLGVVTGSIVVAALILLLAYLALLVSSWFVDRYEGRAPEGSVAHRLTEALAMIKTHGDAWETRVWLANTRMRPIEEAARLIERDVQRALRPNDPATSEWLDAHLGRVAAGVRAWKRHVAMPTRESEEHLRRQIGNSLAHIALGQWRQMRQAEPTRRRSRRARLAQFATTLALAAVPAAALFALQQSRYALEGTLEFYATVSVVLWAVVSVLAAVDPQFAMKLTALRDLSSSVSKSGPKS